MGGALLRGGGGVCETRERVCETRVCVSETRERVCVLMFAFKGSHVTLTMAESSVPLVCQYEGRERVLSVSLLRGGTSTQPTP